MKEIFRAIDDAYFLLDKCIVKLLKGRITKDEKLEQEAYCDMEYAVNGTMQNLSYLEGRLKGKTLNDWIKVEDRLPEVNTEVLVARFSLNCGWWYEVASVYKNDFNQLRWYDQDGWDLDDVTHWMPIFPPNED